MTQNLAAITYLVRDYDEAITWFTDKLGFKLVEGTAIDDKKRWVRISNAGDTCCLLLAKADGPEQIACIGKAAGGRVAFFLHTTDFETQHGKMKTAGITFLENPRHEHYGTVAVFVDLYGNKWDLIQSTKNPA